MVFDTDGPGEVYIGESEDVRRCGRQYRRGDRGQKTSRWVHEHLPRRLDQGATVRVELVVSARFAVGGGPWRDTDLGRKEHRLILENAALAIAIAATAGPTGLLPAVVLNRIADNHAEP